MGESFRAAEWRAGQFQVREFPLTQPGPGQVRVRVSACSVCLTEVHYTDGYYDELADLAPAFAAARSGAGLKVIVYLRPLITVRRPWARWRRSRPAGSSGTTG
jgi:hypothetical protein